MPKVRFNGPEEAREVVLESGPVLVHKNGEFDCNAAEKESLIAQGFYSAVKGKTSPSPKPEVPAVDLVPEVNAPAEPVKE